MSAPNKNYDPVEVTALTADEVDRAVAEALAAIGAAKDLDQLKEARLAHAGDKAPLSLASSEIGALPPEARAEAGRRVGAARGRLREALRERQVQLEA
ncbi:MAG TPA: phenylalanine--tRNA ligase subunit alpha, partial [Trebonia sp.]|nr:phenylalanine--tRNA ligase subunit alpha [Trebonia sp.]